MLWWSFKSFQNVIYTQERSNYNIGMKQCFFCRYILLFMFPVCHVSLFGYCSLVVICWERADLLAVLYLIFIVLLSFSDVGAGSAVVLDFIDS